MTRRLVLTLALAVAGMAAADQPRSVSAVNGQGVSKRSLTAPNLTLTKATSAQPALLLQPPVGTAAIQDWIDLRLISRGGTFETYLDALETDSAGVILMYDPDHDRWPDRWLQSVVRAGSNTIESGVPDAAGAALKVDAWVEDGHGGQAALSNAGAKIVCFLNWGTETACIDLNGVGEFGGGVIIGSTGTAIGASYRATAVIDIASIAANVCATDSTITVTGAATGAECIVGSPATLNNGLIQTCFVSAANTVKLRTCNSTAGAIDPASATYSVRVFSP